MVHINSTKNKVSLPNSMAEYSHAYSVCNRLRWVKVAESHTNLQRLLPDDRWRRIAGDSEPEGQIMAVETVP